MCKSAIFIQVSSMNRSSNQGFTVLDFLAVSKNILPGKYEVYPYWRLDAARSHQKVSDSFDAQSSDVEFAKIRVQISTSMILTNVLHPHLDAATDFPVVHHRGRSRSGCSHMTSDLPLGSQWGRSLCHGSSCPLM